MGRKQEYKETNLETETETETDTVIRLIKEFMKFKVGDKIACYSVFGRTVGVVEVMK